jgi:hypothetical protein
MLILLVPHLMSIPILLTNFPTSSQRDSCLEELILVSDLVIGTDGVAWILGLRYLRFYSGHSVPHMLVYKFQILTEFVNTLTSFGKDCPSVVGAQGFEET